ncbi:hypothetical protein C2E23DRAFT_743223 [Lenzites betulinus]|nr:hypothetical protein C2E23DRAFT_743223 [Lenzites betulinus]
MSEQTARAHTSTSNRAKAWDHADRKIVFKSVVDNPFRVQWPHAPANVQNAILACVVEMLTGVADYNLSRERTSRRKRKRSQSTQDGGAVITLPSATNEPTHLGRVTAETSSTVQSAAIDTVNAAPSILGSLVIGINEVTKRLEVLANSHRRTIHSEGGHDSNIVRHSASSSPVGCLVIACRADVDPPALINHIPALVAACNTRREVRESTGSIWLVSLPKGSEHTLAAAVGLRRACIMLIQDPMSYFPALAPLLQPTSLLVAPWLESGASARPTTLIPTHVKQVRTTAPKDMKAAKDKRARTRAAAKERRKHKSTLVPKRITLSSTG